MNPTDVPTVSAFMQAFEQDHYNPKAFIATSGPDQGQQFVGGRSLRRRMLLAVNANLFAGLNLAAHINLRRWIVPHEDDGQAGPHSGSSHGLHFRRNFAADVACDLRAV